MYNKDIKNKEKNMTYNLKTLENGCKKLEIELNQKQKDQFIQFYEYLVEKNKVMNLTGITEFEEVLTKHFWTVCPV